MLFHPTSWNHVLTHVPTRCYLSSNFGFHRPSREYVSRSPGQFWNLPFEMPPFARPLSTCSRLSCILRFPCSTGSLPKFKKYHDFAPRHFFKSTQVPMIVSTAEEMNPMRRCTMEDVLIVHPENTWDCKDSKMAFLGIVDGHGGTFSLVYICAVALTQITLFACRRDL